MKTFLRHANDYYGMLPIFDDLYKRSQEDDLDGIDLYSIITSRNNILLAYRTIKNNKGSTTSGTDGLTIKDFKNISIDEYVNIIQNKFNNYKPKSVKRVMIPKPNGDKRPLGIPTMIDRIIQQCIKQVLEPICEAKFYNHSYGFRPNRSTHDAMARCQYLINMSKLHHVVDVDIKGFFDNVNHTKLLKQLYNIGIQDKRVLKIISKILKSPIEGEGIPTKGVPQGGVISTLLSNVVLNDLDWWIANQWEFKQTSYNYSNGKKSRALKKTKLKQMYIVRYADDFKVFTNSHKSATKIYHAVKGYLKDNLKLDISPEKSKVINLRRHSSEFLGFSIKTVKKAKRRVANTHVSNKNKKKIETEIRQRIKQISKHPNSQTITNYNSYILGIHNYYKIATHVNIDFNEIAYHCNKALYNRLKSIGKYSKPKNPNATYKKHYKNNFKTFEIAKVYLYPIADIKTRSATCFTQQKCNYTKEGRELLEYQHLNQFIIDELSKLRNSATEYASVELADNKISRYSMQQGSCAVTNELLIAKDVECHHIIPKKLGGTDEFKNIVIIHYNVHKLIHATKQETIVKYLELLKLSKEQIKKVNKYRKKCNLEIIKINKI